jgi:hypothetical protein
VSAGVVLSVELEPANGADPLSFEWDADNGQVDIRRDGSLLLVCTLDDIIALIPALQTFVEHYETDDSEDDG